MPDHLVHVVCPPEVTLLQHLRSPFAVAALRPSAGVAPISLSGAGCPRHRATTLGLGTSGDGSFASLASSGGDEGVDGTTVTSRSSLDGWLRGLGDADRHDRPGLRGLGALRWHDHPGAGGGGAGGTSAGLFLGLLGQPA